MCWFNIIRPGEEIKIHKHGSGPDVYLSGNLHLDDYDTETFYLSPYDEQNGHALPNQKGGLTLFPSYVSHGATKYEGDSLRVSIAFDLRLPNTNSNAANIKPFTTQESLANND
jgi:ectoine hydroxylase-related dioxygenase (phytanoyl-CoA dioxygenase family)